MPVTSARIQPPSPRQLYWVADNVIASDFPDVNSALRDPDGLLAIGGDLGPDCLLDAYRRGIFPWYGRGQPILWWSPDPRCVLELDNFRVSRSLRRTLRRGVFRVTFNSDFEGVLRGCAEARARSSDTWITPEMARAYTTLHRMGHAVSVECWNGGELAGGLYGVVLGRVFFGESMFSRETDASKVALAHLVHTLRQKEFRLIDCQVHSRHLQSLGATPMPRRMFVNILSRYCPAPATHQWPAESTLP
jgi:leucyl/phenylalanyl-tRNA--protein transferase